MKKGPIKSSVQELDSSQALRSSSLDSVFAALKENKEGPMISQYTFKRIRELLTDGHNLSEISRKLGIDRKTVRKYRDFNTPPRYRPRLKSTRKDPLVGYVERLKELLELNSENTAREIYELLLEEGYIGSERTVQRKVREILGSRRKERFFEQEYDPGEQAQFDFKERVPLPFVDGTRMAHLHFGTLPHSDTCWVRGYPFRVYECFIDGIHSFFEKIGGQSSNIRIDNLSPCVKKVLKGNERIYTESFQRAINYYGFRVLPCRPSKGSDKGDVERDIRTFASRIQNMIKNKQIVFQDWDDLNAFLESYMSKRQSELTQSRFKEEQKALRPLPPRDEDVLCKVDISQSNSYGTLRVGKSTYSIPDEMIQSPCKVVLGPYDVKVYPTEGQKRLVVCHPRQSEGEHSLLLEHVLPSLVRKPQAMVRWAHRHLLFPTDIFQSFYQRLKRQDLHSCEREYLRTINLIQHVSWQDLSVAMELQLESKEAFSFESTRELLLGRPSKDMDRQQEPLQPRLSQYDSLIPQTGGHYEP